VAAVIRPNSFDHVALWVDDRHPLAEFLCDHLGMHVIEKQNDFTLVGVDAKEGKLTLFDAEGPRERGVLERITLRVGDLDSALAGLPEDLAVEREDGVARFRAPSDVTIGLVEAHGLDYDLDHVLLRVPDPDQTAEGLSALGFERANGGLAVADRHVRLEAGDAGDGGRPLLNHLALLVDSTGDVEAEAERRGLEVAKLVETDNTRAVFLNGPDGIVVEYVEHKPGFSLV
jgi:catechol 2,3-dioxygenase-like lactoylglutathione lyase family enzyme